MNRIQAVIFDMDGLLLDTEAISLNTFLEACQEYGYKPDVDVYYRCIGTTSARTKEIFIEGFGPDFPYQAINTLWRQKYREQTIEKPVPLKSGVLDLLQQLEKKGMRRAVVTSTRQSNAVKMLDNAGILHFFEFVLGGDQISHGKPDPEIYLTACHRLGLESSQCLALEDSDNGVLSAFNAGLLVIQVPDIKEPSDQVKALGHRIIKSLSYLSLSSIYV